jgi:tetratricopeptide (TPR) repeat protein
MPAEALALADALLLERPDDLFVRLGRVRALAWSGRQRESEAALLGLVNDDLNNAYLLYILGRLQHAENRLPEAAANLRRSLAFYDRAAVTRKELVEVLATQGRFWEAIEIGEGIGSAPADALTSLLARARSFHFSGRLEQAGRWYREVLASYPQNREALWGLVETSTYMGHFASAEHTLEQWRLAAAADDRYEIQRQLLGAYTRPTLDAKTDYYDNSSDFSRINAGADGRVYLGSGVTLIPAYAFSDFRQKAFSDIRRNAFSLSTEFRPGDFIRVSAGLGVSLYDTDRQRFTFRESVTVTPVQGFEVGISHQHLEIIDTEPIFRNPIFNYVVTLGAVGENISSDDFTLDLLLLPRHDFTVWGRLIYGDYSDHNRKLSRILGIDYKPSSISGLKLSYNYFFLDYADPAPRYTENTSSVEAYYDPTNLEVHSLSVGYDLSITEALCGGVQLSISHLPKSNGLASALFGYVSLKLSKSHSIRLDVRYFHQDKGVDRTGTNGSFSARNVMLAYEYTF